MEKKKIKTDYIPFEPKAFLSDIHVQGWMAEEIGAYWMLCCYLYTNGGKCEYDASRMRLVCHVVDDWGKIWKSIRVKFQIKGNVVSHKRVSEAIKYALESQKKRSAAGKVGAKARWESHGNRIPVAMPRKEKKREDKTNTSNSKGTPGINSNSLRHYEYLRTHLVVKSASDMTALKNFVAWLHKEKEGINVGIEGIVKESMKGKNPMAVFFSIVKKDLGYKPKG